MTDLTNHNFSGSTMDVNAKRKFIINYCRNTNCDKCIIGVSTEAGCMFWDLTSDSVTERAFQEFYGYCAERKIIINSIINSQIVSTKIEKSFNKKLAAYN